MFCYIQSIVKGLVKSLANQKFYDNIYRALELIDFQQLFLTCDKYPNMYALLIYTNDF